MPMSKVELRRTLKMSPKLEWDNHKGQLSIQKSAASQLAGNLPKPHLQMCPQIETRNGQLSPFQLIAVVSGQQSRQMYLSNL